MIGSGGCYMGSIIIIIITAPVTTESQNVSEKSYENRKARNDTVRKIQRWRSHVTGADMAKVGARVI